MKKEREFLTPEEAAEILGCSRRTILNELRASARGEWRSGMLYGTKKGKSWVIPRESIEAMKAPPEEEQEGGDNLAR